MWRVCDQVLQRSVRRCRAPPATAVRFRHKLSYMEQYRRSLETPKAFWDEAAQEIEWFRPFDNVVDDVKQGLVHRWFTGGEMNTCHNAVDVHVQNGRGDYVAIRFDSPVTDTKKSVTYKELQQQVSAFAGGLRTLGVQRGDRVVIYMPVMAEAAVAMLACARLGAVHSVVFGGFAAKELAARIDDCRPRVVIAASCGIEPKGVIKYEALLNGALELAKWQPEKCVILQRDQCRFTMKKGRDVDWHDVATKGSLIDSVPVLATDPLYILYTSGTTGKPKGVVRDNGGHAVALKWSMTHVMNTYAGETYWSASDIGWVTVMYEGKPIGTPNPGAWWRVISEYGVKTMFTAPTALRAVRKEDPDLLFLKEKKAAVQQTLEAMFVAGERGDPKTLKFFADTLEIPVVDNWWQTETGWLVSSQCLGMEQDHPSGKYPGIKFGSVSRPVPGFNVQLMSPEKSEGDEQNDYDESNGSDKELVVKLPLPPGGLITLNNNDDEFFVKYLKKFPGYYHTGDTGHIDEDGYIYVMSRTDDVINVAGHRLCTGAIEEVIQSIPEIVECAVFGAADKLKGQIPVGLLVLKNGINRSEKEIIEQVISDVRTQMGSFVCLKSVAVVQALPKTRSGKVIRGTIAAIADGRRFRVPATIENEAVLDDIRAALQKFGYGYSSPE